MKHTSYVSLIYSLLIFLSGIMGYFEAGQLSSLFVEIPLSITALILVFYMIKKKILAHYFFAFLSLVLAIFYGYSFSSTVQFFPGLLGAFSIFICIFNLIHIFHLSTGPD